MKGSPSHKQVAVFGATGAQGGSVANSLLEERDKWRVVALTRDANSDKARKLREAGASICQCDLNKPSEVEACVKGSYAVFGATDFWQAGKEAEIKHGKTIVDVSKKTGVQHLVFSTLEDTNKISGGKRSIEHFDSKAEIEAHMAKSGVPYTAVQPAAYYENMKQMVKPTKDGAMEFTLPISADTRFAQFSVAETGLAVREVLNNRSKYLGKKLALVGDFISPREMAYMLSKQLGKPVQYKTVSEKTFASFPFPGAAELANMFAFFQDYGYYGEKVNKRGIFTLFYTSQ